MKLIKIILLTCQIIKNNLLDKVNKVKLCSEKLKNIRTSLQEATCIKNNYSVLTNMLHSELNNILDFFLIQRKFWIWSFN